MYRTCRNQIVCVKQDNKTYSLIMSAKPVNLQTSATQKSQTIVYTIQQEAHSNIVNLINKRCLANILEKRIKNLDNIIDINKKTHCLMISPVSVAWAEVQIAAEGRSPAWRREWPFPHNPQFFADFGRCGAVSHTSTVQC